MGFKNTRVTTFTNRVTDIRLETRTFGEDVKLQLVVEHEGREYPEWFSFGTGEGITLSKDGHTYTPSDFAFSSKTQGYKNYLGPLMGLLDKAGLEYDDSDLGTIVDLGLNVTYELRTVKTKSPAGETKERDKPYPIAIEQSGSLANRTSKKAEIPEEAVEVFTKLLENAGGEMDTSQITAKALKSVVGDDVSYQDRKKLATMLASDEFLETQEVANVNDGVVTEKD